MKQSERTKETVSDSKKLTTLDYKTVRAQTENLVKTLSSEDQCVQSMADASPTKWHLAHTTWFFETFILKLQENSYVEFDPAFNFLFNSYYNQIGERHSRDLRGLLTRPSLDEIFSYRMHVDIAMDKYLNGKLSKSDKGLVKLGLNHEQQHQELILTDIKHTLSCNPTNPIFITPTPWEASPYQPIEWLDYAGGLVEIGSNGEEFIFDCEGPKHKQWLEPYKLASRPVTNGEYIEFIEDGGYARPELWLSDGWAKCQNSHWQAPLYWMKDGGNWILFTLSGSRPINNNTPLCHISYFEADAYARWANCRLPTEAEWENAAKSIDINGNFSERGAYHPLPTPERGLSQMFGDVWEWTASPYIAYPGFKTAQGAVGEYNGKFMSGQMVLRGGSCATPENHIRSTYRNFFYPKDRWQFSGLRLAQDSHPNKGKLNSSAPHLKKKKNQEFLSDVLKGLSKTKKSLSPKYFYDGMGAKLFEQICVTPEYYPTRTEINILTKNAGQITKIMGPGASLIEFGSGALKKVKIILNAMDKPKALIPLDISQEQLYKASKTIQDEYPNLNVSPIAGDFTKPIILPQRAETPSKYVAFFPGSTIGNFERLDAIDFLKSANKTIGENGLMLIGFDLQKNLETLLSAYDDKEGVTSAFNKNLLTRINLELEGNFDLKQFQHKVHYNESKHRVEMHLQSLIDQSAKISGTSFHFTKNETIHTENCYKFTEGSFKKLTAAAGFDTVKTWTDDNNYFAVTLLRRTKN